MKLYIILLITLLVFTLSASKFNIYNKFRYSRTSDGIEYGEIELTKYYLNVYSSNKYKHYLFETTNINDDTYSFITVNNDTIQIDEQSREIRINDIVYYTDNNIILNW